MLLFYILFCTLIICFENCIFFEEENDLLSRLSYLICLVDVLFLNGTMLDFQINFFKDHTKVIISAEKHGYLVTYINGDRLSCSYWLAHITQFSCETNIYDRLRFAAAVVREFAELDGEEV